MRVGLKGDRSSDFRSRGEVCVYGYDRLSIQFAVGFATVVKPDHADVDVCTVENPIAVAHSEEYVTRLLDPLQHLAICSSAYALCRQKSSPLAPAFLNQVAGLFEPVAAKVRLAGNAVSVGSAEFFNVVIAQLPAHELVAQRSEEHTSELQSLRHL